MPEREARRAFRELPLPDRLAVSAMIANSDGRTKAAERIAGMAEKTAMERDRYMKSLRNAEIYIYAGLSMCMISFPAIAIWRGAADYIIGSVLAAGAAAVGKYASVGDMKDERALLHATRGQGISRKTGAPFGD
ncbi:MAG: hypothetical protein ACP5NX_00100 [Candidatus Bilamarchaeaceae archaeon]